MGLEHVRLNDVLIGGKPVEFTVSTGTLNIAGEDMPLDTWLEKRRRIDMILKRTMEPKDWKALREKLAWLGKRDRLPQELRDYETPAAKSGARFLDHNWEAANEAQRGRMVKAPWFLRWLYDWVVTKESYGNGTEADIRAVGFQSRRSAGQSG